MIESITSDHAPSAIGPYTQAVKCAQTIYLSGQIPLVPETMEMVEGDIVAQARRVFDNLAAVAAAAGATFADFAKLNIYLRDLSHFPKINEVMAEYFDKPYPARAVIGVAALPKNAEIEIDGIIYLA